MDRKLRRGERMTANLGSLGLGTASVGNLFRVVDDKAAEEALEAAWEGGIRYFDTAPHYGLGLAERRLGEFLRTKPRDEYVVSTKVGRLLVDNPRYSGGNDLAQGFNVPDDLIREFDPTLAGVRRAIDESLERMGLDRFDMLFLHDPEVYDLERGLAEGLPALITCREEGLVDAIGVGDNEAHVVYRAVRDYDVDVVMMAGRYTLLEQGAADELLPTAARRRVAVIAAAPFNSGLLSKPTLAPDAHYNYGPIPERVRTRVREIVSVCEEFGTDLPTAAIQFPLRNPAISTVVVGTARASAVRENVSRMTSPIPEAFWRALASRGLIEA